MHVLEQAADKTLVSLHDPGELLVEGRLDGRTDAVQHEPRGFLRHSSAL